MNALANTRNIAARYMLLFLWMHVPVVAATAWLIDGPLVFPLLITAALAAAATATWWRQRGGPATRYALSVALMGMPAVLVYQFAGHPWQIDLHMYFFAALAMLAVFSDWRAILIATVAVAVHHLVLNFALPALVFPEGASFLRVVLHAIVVLLEAAALVWLSLQQVSALVSSERAIAEMEVAREEADGLAAQQRQAEQDAEEQRRQALISLASDFEGSVLGVVDAVGKRADDMEASTHALSETAASTAAQSKTVAGASDQAAGNVSSVASATEELSASIQEISRQVSDSSAISSEAVSEAQNVTAQVQSLSETSNRIGEVIDLINDISSQTNLLALNATIEAARAGEAGKGFAVVASEVKNLAGQTARATEDIARHIVSIQSATGEAVNAMEQISQTIGRINEIGSSIATAVEEQGVATQEISRSIQEVSEGTQGVSRNVAELDTGARSTGERATQVLEATQDMVRQTRQLREDVTQFLAHIRSA